MTPDGGTVSYRKGEGMVMVVQDLMFDADLTVRDIVFDAARDSEG